MPLSIKYEQITRKLTLMIKISAVGKKHEAMYEMALTHFEKRLSQWQRIEWIILPPSGNGTDQARSEESSHILHRLNSKDFVILLDEQGQQVTSPQVADHIEKAQVISRQIVCVIGGAFGVDEQLKARADVVVSFGKVVFPHQLIRVMLTEQLYRAYSILAGSGYHHL